MPKTLCTEYKVNHETFLVRREMLAQEPELVRLITTNKGLKSGPANSLSGGQPIDGRQYWLNLYPIITPTQQKKLKKILQNEATKLHLIDLKLSQTTS